ncbi:MAG: cytochrome c [Dokdonella sp.]|uniref:cytochrome c n=1 Tax=Dokdonella sp. TaxID=2291710 RepID=UPI0025B94483|nr:cytochrome c [Dokdonella sp.]MBX3699433.1 cytochrome c [Dokdonella sp.]
MRCWLLLLMGWIALPVAAAQLTLELDGTPRVFDDASLLRRAEVRRIDIPDDVAYRRDMRYRALPLRALLAGVGPVDHLQLVATDGFVAELPAALLWNTAGSTAWLAIEDRRAPWPRLPGKATSAGPFYLVWTQPQAAGIGTERWPYQLATIRRLPGVAERYPALLPAAELAPDSPIRRGFAVFQATCMACHTLNGAGAAEVGPDLNLPYGPTEYLRADLLRAYIRQPQSLRHWPRARMPGFDARSLPDADLDALLDYLRHMTTRKAALQP